MSSACAHRVRPRVAGRAPLPRRRACFCSASRLRADAAARCRAPARRRLHAARASATACSGSSRGAGLSRMLPAASSSLRAASRLGRGACSVGDLFELLLELADLGRPSASLRSLSCWRAPARRARRPFEALDVRRRSASARARAPRPAAARLRRRARRGRPALCCSLRCASCSRSSADAACAAPFWPPLAAACRIASAASRSCRAASRRGPAAAARATAARAAAPLPRPPGRAAAGCVAAPPPPAGRPAPAALPLGFLLLPPRQLLQLLRSSSTCWSLLLLGALLHLVLVGQLVELELEQVGEILGHLALAAAAAAAAAAALLRPASRTPARPPAAASARAARARARPSGFGLCSFAFGRLHLRGRLRQRSAIVLNAGSCCDEPAVHPLSSFDLLAQLGLRQREERPCSRGTCRRSSSCGRERR